MEIVSTCIAVGWTGFMAVGVGRLVLRGVDAVQGRKRPDETAAKFANPADFLTTHALAAELERRRNADPALFAAAIADDEAMAPSLLEAVKEEKKKAAADAAANAVSFPSGGGPLEGYLYGMRYP